MSENGESAWTSDLERLLSSIHWTLQNRLGPFVTGDLGQSYLRTLVAMTEVARKRVRHEWKALDEGIADISATLDSLGLLPESERSDHSPADTAHMERRLSALDAILVNALDGLDAKQKVIYDGYVQRQVARRLRWYPETPGEHAF